MIDLDILKTRGVSAEKWAEIFQSEDNRLPTFDLPHKGEPLPANAPGQALEGEDKKKVFTGLNLFRNRMRLRIQTGRDHNFQNYLIHKGVDDAFDVPLKKAVTPTLLQMLADRTGTEESLKKELSAFGFNLDDVVLEVTDPKVDGKNNRKVSAPAFFQVFVPLVKAYLTIRQGKIMNDMLVSPFFEYQPAWESAKTRLQCDVISSRMEVMTEQFGYYDTLKQGVFQMLHYGRALQFPVEAWYTETQEVADAKDATTEKGLPVMDGPAEKNGRYYRITKEGLRYHFPHPTRTFYDQAHPPCTFNTDTGCSFAGYWRVLPYRDVLDNTGYFNKDKISIGNYGWYGTNSTFFTTVYPCQLQFPGLPGGTSNSRESKLIDNVYSQDMSDKAVVITEYFERFIPKDFGLGDYAYPIWGRFVVAGDDTVIYAEPLPYAPTIFYGYDDDQARAQNASLSLEILPFQDHLSNLLTQYLLMVKQNLANITFVDEDIVEPKWLTALENLGEKLFRKRNFVRFSGKKYKYAQQTAPTAFYSHSFQPLDTNGLSQAMKTILDICERVLQMSSQELGQAASHEQTKAEVLTVGRQTSTRLQYTTTPVVQARHAMMRQLYYADMAFGSEAFWAGIPMDRQVTGEMLKALGLTWDEKLHPVLATDRKRVVQVKRSAILIEQFAGIRQGEDRQNNGEIAMALLQSLDRLMAGPLGPAIGAEQGVTLVNLAGKLAGWPRDFKLKNMSPQLSAEQQAEQIKQQLAGFISQIEQKIMGEVKTGLMPMLQKDKETEQQVAQLSQAVAHLVAINEHAHPQLQLAPGMPASAVPPGMAAQPGMTQTV